MFVLFASRASVGCDKARAIVVTQGRGISCDPWIQGNTDLAYGWLHRIHELWYTVPYDIGLARRATTIMFPVNSASHMHLVYCSS